MRLSGCQQTPVHGAELRVPAERCGEGRGVEAFSQALATPIDASYSDLVATVVVIGSKAGERGGLLAGERADLRHAHHDGDRSSLADALDAGNQVKPLGKGAVLTDCCDELLELDPQPPFKASDLLVPEFAHPGGGHGFA